MIIRARPKYYESGQSFENPYKRENQSEEFFFNSGRSALKFLLSTYSLFLGRPPTILIQSFNCTVVLDAALQAGWRVALADIKLEDFSLGINALKSSAKKPDAVLLTHYQGIPNLEYREIAQFCREREIFLIDDLAQTEQSKICDITAGSLADVSMHSYAFDKPFSVFQGGSLDLRLLNNQDLKNLLLDRYKNLKTESIRNTGLDLNTLAFLYRYSDETNYVSGINNYQLVRFLLRLGIPSERIYQIIKNKYISTGFSYFFSGINRLWTGETITTKKCLDKKVIQIRVQQRRFIADDTESKSLEEFLKIRRFVVKEYPQADINWNRYSILETSGKLAQILIKLGIEAGNFNWSQPLHKLYSKNNKVILDNSYENSEIASKYIVNIPVWSTFFQNLKRAN